MDENSDESDSEDLTELLVSVSNRVHDLEDKHLPPVSGMVVTRVGARDDYEKCSSFLRQQFRPSCVSSREWLNAELPDEDDDDPTYQPPSEHEDSDFDDLDDEATQPTSEQATFECKRCDPPCASKFNPDGLQEVRQEFSAMTQDEHRMHVQGMILSATRHPHVNLTTSDLETRTAAAKRAKYAEDNPTQRVNLSIFPMIFSVFVCLDFFKFLTSAGERVIRNIREALNTHQFTATSRQRKADTGVTQSTRLGYRGRQAVRFILGVAAQDGYVYPGHRDGKVDKPAIHLPVGFTRKLVHQHYVQSALSAKDPNFQHDPINYSAFRQLWRTKCRHVKIMKRRTDMCETCTKLRSHRLEGQLLFHLEQAHAQRTFIFCAMMDAKNSYFLDDPSLYVAWISADFAEKIRLPYFIDQPSQLFFMSGLQIELFGMVDDMACEQMNYLLVEGWWPHQKGQNTVGSIFFQRLQTYDHYKHSRQLVLHTDNCSSQFKNRWFVWFWLWWVIAAPTFGCHTTIVTHHFNLAGHTKFSPDRGFAGIKCALKRESCFNAQMLFDVIENRSGRHNRAGFCDNFFDWKAFLGQFFNKIVDDISLMHHFEYDAKTPGVVRFKRMHDDEWQSKNLFRSGVTTEMVLAPMAHGHHEFEQYPLAAVPPTAERQQALDQIDERYLRQLNFCATFCGPCH